MDNDQLDELERRAMQWFRDADGYEYPIDGDNLLALITAARRPALPDREAVCSLGVGCEQSGVCYASAHDQPERCGRAPSPAQAEREGWVLVPREPTEAMVAAGWEVANLIGPSTLGVITDTNCYDTYRAMLSAAPKVTI